jgi:putative ABC transport system substrate-binding protein
MCEASLLVRDDEVNKMRRRKFIAATAALLVSPPRSRAQGTRRRLGVLVIGTGIDKIALLDGLRNRGWIDGRNLIIEYRYAQSQDHLPALAAELVALSPDLLIAVGSTTAVALKSATATIPIVFVAGGPISSGSASSKAYRVQAAT